MNTLRTLLILTLTLIFIQVRATTEAELESEVSGSGQAVILIPGLTCSGDVWDSTIESMGEGYQYHALTLPGFAGNEPLEDIASGYFDQMENLVLEYIDKNKIKDPVIIGHSLGGFLALKLAIDRPEMPSKLVIVDALPYLTAIQMPHLTRDSAQSMAANIRTQILSAEEQPREAKLAYQKQILGFMISDQERVAEAAEWGADSDNATIAQAMYEMYTTDIRDQLDQIKAPTLALGSWIAYKAYGVTRESNMAAFKSQYAKLEGITIDMTDTGKHFIMWDDPEFFNSWLRKFL